MITPKLTEGTFRRFEERRIQYINHGSIGRNVPITTLYRRMPVQFPNTQALNCKTFRPPIDILQQQSLSIPELYEWNAENNPDHPLFVYHDGEELQSILWPDALRAIRRAAHVVASGVKGAATPAGRPPVIAIFATTEMITYFCLIVGMLYAGCTVFPISTRNGPAAIAHLLSQTQASYLFVSNEPAIQNIAREAVHGTDSFKQSVAGKPEIHLMPVFEDLFSADSSEHHVMSDMPQGYDLDAPAVILHSSGSTAMPKPIAWTHRDLLESALTPWFGEVDLAGVAMGCHSLPMFHGMGMLHLCFAPSCGVVIATFKPSSPAILPTPNHVFRGLVMTNSLLTCCIPSFIEQWSHDPEKVAYMQKMQGVIYGGGPLSKETGDRLASQGVSIYSNYACTELGVVNTYLSKNPGMEWEWFTFSGQCRPELIPYGDGTYEFIAISHITNHPKVLNTKVGNHDAYATSDLLVPHPTKPSFWKVFGRADDQIMLSTGEMTNPGPLEHVLSQDFWIRSAVMFGRGRFQNGVLIDPRLGYGFDPENVTLLENFRNNIWSSVERMNAFALPHSRVSKEMILVASPSKPFEYTAKNTPRRPVILAMYREEISALYDAVERTMQREFNAPLIWSSEEILDFVRAIVANALARPIADDADIFECGCDSVQATWIRNSILRALRERDPDAVKRVSANFVFRALSVTGLVKAMSDALEPSSYGLETSTKVEALQRMVERYASAFPLRPSTSARTAQEGQDVVLVTGTTSGFGCDILAELLQDASVNRVYAFNHNPRDVTMRQRAAFRQRGLDEALLLQPKYQHVEGDLSVSGLNIDPQLMQEIRNSTTHIIHNAWQVDQTLSHASFENNVKALRNLVDLALSSPLAKPPRLLFVSSIGVLRNSNTRGPALEVSNDDASLAAGSGYTESKWVAERILDLAARSTDLRPITVRLGQICGDRLGHWNEREWFPSMVKSALFQRCLPDLAGTVSWIPASEAAAALVEMRNSSSLILHLAHPRPVSWTSIIDPLAKDLGVPLVPYSAWVATLHKSPVDETAEGQQLGQNPALRLIHFFRNCKVDEDKEPLGITRLATDKAMKVAPSLNIQELGVEHVKKWLSAWRSSGFLPARKRD